MYVEIVSIFHQSKLNRKKYLFLFTKIALKTYFKMAWNWCNVGIIWTSNWSAVSTGLWTLLEITVTLFLNQYFQTRNLVRRTFHVAALSQNSRKFHWFSHLILLQRSRIVAEYCDKIATISQDWNTTDVE